MSQDDEISAREACPFDTDGDGDCGQRNCPFCGEFSRPATSGSQDVRLRDDDEHLMRQVQEWLEQKALPAGQAVILFPTRHHADVVARELMRRIGGEFRKQDVLVAPGGSKIYIVAENRAADGVCGRGVNRVFIHNDVGFRAYAAMKPCELGDDVIIDQGGMVRRA